MNLLRPVDRDVNINGARLRILDWGGEGRTPLLLLHGFTGHAHAWDTLSIALQPHFHVYALDQRGLAPLIIVGLSMGGRNAMYFTSKRPEAVRKLVIVDIGPEISKRASQP